MTGVLFRQTCGAMKDPAERQSLSGLFTGHASSIGCSRRSRRETYGLRVGFLRWHQILEPNRSCSSFRNPFRRPKAWSLGRSTARNSEQSSAVRHYLALSGGCLGRNDGVLAIAHHARPSRIERSWAWRKSKYVSTRGGVQPRGFSDAMLAGLAEDGGLFVPDRWPQLSQSSISGMAGRPYEDIAAEVMLPFIGGDFSEEEFRSLVDEAYSEFNHPARCPLVRLTPAYFFLSSFTGRPWRSRTLRCSL